MLCVSARLVALLRLRRPEQREQLQPLAASRPLVRWPRGATVELLLPVVDAGGELETGVAAAAAFLSLRFSAAASLALVAAASCDSSSRLRFGICRAQTSWTHKCLLGKF